MEDYDKAKKKELIYKVGKPLLGQFVSCAGAIAMVIVTTKGIIKEDDGLFFTGLIPSGLFMYSSYLYHKKTKCALNEYKYSNKLEQKFKE